MKRKLHILIAALTALVFASCSLSNTLEQKEKKTKTAYITIDADNARTALPGINSAADFDSFALIGTTDDKALSIKETWITDENGTAYNKMLAASIEVKAGKTYDFTLSASKNSALWEGELQKAIKAGTNKLAFILDYIAPSADGKGNLEIELSVPSNVVNVTAILYSATKDVVIYPEYSKLTFDAAAGKATYTASEIDAGNYVLVYTLWGDTAKTYKLGEWREYAGISKGLTSSSTPAIASNDELESIYKITIDYDGGKLEGATIPGSYTRYSDDIVLPTAEKMSKYGYTFAGWKIDSTTVTKIEKGTVGNITVTAEWTPEGNFLSAAKIADIQQSLTNASAGSTVILTPAGGFAPLGSSITISKALTVDGNGIEGLAINVTSDVKDKLTLKNFKNATLKVVAGEQSSSTTSDGSRAVSINDTESEDGERIEKFGDDAVPLRLEGCEIKEFIAEEEVALYFGTGDERSEIEKLALDLNEGEERFTLLENDNGINENDRSSIGTLYVEDGLKEINLIGGSFDDVDFSDDFSFDDEKLRFNYDPEFEQFKDDEFLKDEEFLKDIELRDIALAEYENTNGTGVYKFEMTPADFQKLNGYMGVIFLNDEQVEAAKTSSFDNFWRSATYETPMYNMSIMGAFRVKERTKGLQPVYGRNSAYLDYHDAFFGNNFRDYVKKTYLDYFQIYSKDAVVIDIEEDIVTLYVNMAAIKKQDVTINITPNYEDTSDAADGIFEGGSKLTKVDLTGYKPYFIIDTGVQLDNGVSMANESSVEYAFLYDVDASEEFNGEYGPNAVSFIDDCLTSNEEGCFPPKRWIYLPISSDQKSDLGEPMYYPFAMSEITEETEAYPDVSAVEAEEWSVNQAHITVAYYDSDLQFMYNDELVIKENLYPMDGWEYYFDDKFEYKIPADQNAFAGGLNWNFEFQDKPESIKTVYARPKRFVSFFTKVTNPETMQEEEEYLPSDNNMGYINFPNISSQPIIFFKAYDPETKKFSDKITKPTEVNDYDIIYLVDAYVNLVIANPNNANEIKEIGKLNVITLPITGEGGEYNPNGNVGETYFYDTPEMDAGTQYTPATKNKLNECLGTNLYFNLPVKVLTSDHMSVKTTLNYFEFKEKLEKGEKFYSATEPATAHTDEITGEVIPAQTLEDITWTSAKLEKYAPVNFVNGMVLPIAVYDELANKTPVILHDLVDNYDEDGNPIKMDEPTNTLVSSVLADLDTGIATFYSDAELKTLLTRAQISELTANSNIYRKYKTFKVYMLNNGEVPDTPEDRAINIVLLEVNNDPSTHYYADADCKVEYTSGSQIKALEEGTELYLKFDSQNNQGGSDDQNNQGGTSVIDPVDPVVTDPTQTDPTQTDPKDPVDPNVTGPTDPIDSNGQVTPEKQDDPNVPDPHNQDDPNAQVNPDKQDDPNATDPHNQNDPNAQVNPTDTEGKDSDNTNPDPVTPEDLENGKESDAPIPSDGEPDVGGREPKE